MDKGDIGLDVGKVQLLLVQAGYTLDPSELSSVTYGTSTETSVIEFQRANGLTADGITGPNTLNALKAKTALRGGMALPVISVSDYISLLITAGVDPKTANTWGFGLYEAMTEKNIILNKAEVCSFTANVLHETGQLTTFEENLNYSATALVKLWPTHFTVDDANKYGRTANQPADQKAIANLAYANRMGNGSPTTGDGWCRRGQGPFQLTGTNNYQAFADYSGVDVMAYPSRLTQSVVGSKSAVWFWIVNKCGPLARALDHKGVCNKINGGENGLKHRIELTEFFLSKM